MEDWLVWFALASAVAVILIAVNLFGKRQGKKQEEEGNRNVRENAVQRGARAGPAGGGGRRAGAAARNRRTQRRVEDSDSDTPPAERVQPQPQQQHQARDDDSDRHSDQDTKTPFDAKLGAKKRAKLEAKEEKRQQREVEERIREEKKAKDAKENEERKKREEQEDEDEKRKAEEEKRLLTERLQREQEEYLQLKAQFTVEDEGCGVRESEEEENLLEKFIEYIKTKKVVPFEELATKFGLKVSDAINRVNTLIAEERLTGVLDDRGKFIYVSEEELKKFVKFIQQRGRVSISDLVDNSSSIINLSQNTEVKADA